MCFNIKAFYLLLHISIHGLRCSLFNHLLNLTTRELNPSLNCLDNVFRITFPITKQNKYGKYCDNQVYGLIHVKLCELTTRTVQEKCRFLLPKSKGHLAHVAISIPQSTVVSRKQMQSVHPCQLRTAGNLTWHHIYKVLMLRDNGCLSSLKINIWANKKSQQDVCVCESGSMSFITVCNTKWIKCIRMYLP